MSAMVERVARAIYDAADASGEYVGTWDRAYVVLDGAFDLRVLARAALAAMREPTEEMLDAVSMRDIEGTDAHAWRMEAADHWRAMIDAALDAAPAVKENPPTQEGP